ncbi:BlaI/MecI/CopY family transcriptional regulator [Nocardioides solisilvae]|uniref:BlaI/MecI/CopY family transcriptional regulator n=1 Tax=Nocardioides solisilvae TaxID=1542435 RepID=UPI001EF48369|nr:BlaI/MecI/CopY family transcriptional regulator [Nocardioides solisilvae]
MRKTDRTTRTTRTAPGSAGKAGLGELERAVMDVLWDLGPDADATVREVHGRLSEGRDVAYTTVMTVMDRLARKGVVVQQKEGRAYRYRAQATRAEMTADLMRDTLADLGSSERAPALVAFVEDASAEDLAALRKALAALES